MHDDGIGTIMREKFLNLMIQMILHRDPKDEIRNASRSFGDDETGKFPPCTMGLAHRSQGSELPCARSEITMAVSPMSIWSS